MGIADLIQSQDEAKAHTWNILLWPKLWVDYMDTRPDNWVKQKLHKATDRTKIPKAPGIYTLIVQPGIANHPGCSHVMYVGKADNLNKRFGEYLTKEQSDKYGRPKIFRLLHKFPDHMWFCFCEIPKKDLHDVEDHLINAYAPPCNDDFPAEISKTVKAF